MRALWARQRGVWWVMPYSLVEYIRSETFRAKLIYAIDSAYASPLGSLERGVVDHAF